MKLTRKEIIIRLTLAAVLVFALVYFDTSCNHPEKVQAKDLHASVVAEPVAPETMEVLVETETEYIEPETEPEVYEEEDIYEETEFEPETEVVIEETEESDDEDTVATIPEHDCCDFYEEYYTEELGWSCYKHECVVCGETEYFEYAEDTEEVEESEECESVHTDDDCCEFTDPDENGIVHCLECGTAYCFED